MLSRQLLTRAAAPFVARQTVRNTGSVSLKVAVPRAPISTRATVLPLPTVKSEVPLTTPSVMNSSGSDSHHAEIGSSSGASSSAMRAAVLVAMGGLIALLMDDAANGEVDSKVVAEMRHHINVFTSRFGLTAHQCDAAASEFRPTVVALRPTRVAPSHPPPVVADDLKPASLWTRLFAYVLDAFSIQIVLVALSRLVLKVKPGMDLNDGSHRTVITTLLLQFFMQLGSLICLNGQTVGKKLCGLRVQRLDLGDLDSLTALKLSASQAIFICTIGVVELLPLVKEEYRRNNQLLHNVISNTTVVKVKRNDKQKKEEEEESDD